MRAAARAYRVSEPAAALALLRRTLHRSATDAAVRSGNSGYVPPASLGESVAAPEGENEEDVLEQAEAVQGALPTC